MFAVRLWACQLCSFHRPSPCTNCVRIVNNVIHAIGNENTDFFQLFCLRAKRIALIHSLFCSNHPFQVDENDNLPKKLCDSCIIQLNVAYGLKRNAVQSDIRLRQFVIENGLMPATTTTCINTISIVRPTEIIMPTRIENSAEAMSSNQSLSAEKQAGRTQPERRFAVTPIVIKEEPLDCDGVSETTVDTENGVDTFSNGSSPANIGRRKEASLPPNQMVAVNPSAIAETESSDDDYLNGYLQTPQSSTESPREHRPPAECSSPRSNNTPRSRASQKTHRPPRTPRSSPRNSPKGTQSKGSKHFEDVLRKTLTVSVTKMASPTRELRKLGINMTDRSTETVTTPRMAKAKTIENLSKLIPRVYTSRKSSSKTPTLSTTISKSKQRKRAQHKISRVKPARISI